MRTKERDHLGVCVRIKAGGLRLCEGSEQLRLSDLIDVGAWQRSTPGAGKRKQTPFNPSTGAASPLAGTAPPHPTD